MTTKAKIMNCGVVVRVLVCVLVSLSPLISVTAGFNCTPDTMWSRYFLSSSPVPFNGNDTIASTTAESRCFASGSDLLCEGASTSTPGKLANGDTGSVDLEITAIHAWRETFDVRFDLGSRNPAVTVTAVNLYFYNIPSMRIGLPFDIQLYYGDTENSAPNPITNYMILGNGDLSQEDNRLRNVTLLVTDTGVPTYRSLRVRFGISDSSHIDWLLLSEVELCTGTPPLTIPAFDAPSLSNSSNVTIQLGPMENVISNLTLSCSVVNEGLFNWTWTFPSVDVQFEQRVVDASRTSIVELSKITLADGYAGGYKCQAAYHPNALPADDSIPAFRIFNLDLQSEIIANSTTVRFTGDDTYVAVSCEFSGYIRGRGQDVTISWLFENNEISNGPVYEITIEDGDGLILDGQGNTRPSVRSILRVTVDGDTAVAGSYVCQTAEVPVKQIELTRVNGPSPPSSTTASSQAPTSSPAGPDITYIIIGAVVGFLVIVVLLIVITIVVLCVCRRRANAYNMDMDDKDEFGFSEPFYQEVNKPLPPPLPERFPFPPGSSSGAYAMIDHNGESNGHIELVSMDNQRSSVCSAPDPTNPTPMRLVKNQPDFLQNNPLYASADHLDRDRSPPDFHHPHRSIGSIPSMGSSHNSTLNIYAQPSRIIPPVPRRPSTPTLLGKPIYSEANITPAVFRQTRQSSPDNELHPYASIYDDPRPLIQSEGPCEIQPHNVREKRNLGLGQFGQVILAETVGISLKDLKLSETNNDKNVTVLVAIKKLKPDADIHVKEAFEKEIKFMSRLKDDNVVRLLGICPHGDIFIVMEYMENGDLNQYLRKHDIAPLDSPPGENQLPPSALLFLALQIASGMKYLATLRFIHRDLATRNCLVGRNNEVKIADFGMSRSLYSSYYYRIKGRAMLPIRWMANECFYGRFSEKTDVWAFGVTMWEIFTFAKKQPYEEMSDQELIDDAIKGPERQLLPRPEHCPQEVYDVMLQCWIDDVDERKKFDELRSMLAAIYDRNDIP